MANKTSQHILSTAANLLGFCLFVITSLHIQSQIETNFLDKVTSIIALFLTVSCVFSFISIRTKKEVREKRMEFIADVFFMFSLLGILLVIFMVTMNFV